MIQDDNAVYQLIGALRANPQILPLAEMAAVHETGHDLLLDATDETIVAVLSPRRDARLGRLTPREQQVATLIAAGYTNRQIAVALSIALSTVKDHVHAMLAKTGFESRSQLIAAWYGGSTKPG